MGDSKKIQVAFIHPDLGIGGAERLVLDVAVALKEEGNEVLFVANHFDKNHAFKELKEDEFLVRVIGDWIPRHLCGIFQALCAYLRMIYLTITYLLFFRQKDNPDVYFVDQIPMAVPFIKWAGCKVIYYCHHPDLLASPSGGFLKKLYRCPINWLELKGTKMADVILVNSEYTASVFRTTFPSIESDIHVLYPAISSSLETMISNKRPKAIDQLVPEITTSSSNVVFLSINRFHPAKKLELAIEALCDFRTNSSSEEWQNIHLIIAGGYDPQSSVNHFYFNKLVKLTQTRELDKKVIFLKSPSDALKIDLLLSCDCLIYTPVNEHFGIVPLEAMSAAKPVIACNSGGPRETVQDGKTGYLCEPTPGGMAEAMKKIFNKDIARSMGMEGKKRLNTNFSNRNFSKQVNETVRTAVDVECIPIDNQP